MNVPILRAGSYPITIGTLVDYSDIPVLLGFPCCSADKESACNVGDLGSIPGLGRSPREKKGHPLQYSVLKNSMDSIVHGVAKSWTQLSDFHLLACFTGEESDALGE